MGVRGSRHRAPSRGNPQGVSGKLLLQALEDLSELDFRRFRDALAHGDLGGRRCIPWGRLQQADWIHTKNLMLDAYGEQDALDVAIAVFESVQLRNAANRLRESRDKDLGLAPLPGSSSPDYRGSYKKAVRQAYSRMKDLNARVGDSVSLDARYSKLVIVSKHRDEEQREHEIVAVGRRHAEIMKEQASAAITVQELFKPGPDGWVHKVVVLLGAAGVGKTMTARKIMLDWASDKLFEEFDYVFYIHCREGHLLASQASLAELIARCCPGSPPPLAQVLRQPEKLLFIIDGFDELRFSFDRPPSELCSQPWEPRPAEITLSSLFRRRLLPESWLLVTTRPAALRQLGQCLHCERYAEILGFSEAERKEYFHRFFEDAEQAAAAFRLVRGNEILFTMCLVPIVCWVVCTVMKQQLSRAGGLARSPRTTTGIYVLYLSALLRSLSTRLRHGVPGVLRRLCGLAADGVWRQKVLFEEREVRGYALDRREALPLLLNEHLFQKDISCVSTYSFIHLSFQEFFAALFYLLEDEEGAPEPPAPAGPSRDVRELLESYGGSRNRFLLTVRFLCGLLNAECRRELERELGCRIGAQAAPKLLAWLQSRQRTALALLTQEMAAVRELELCHCLYELQDARVVAAALEPFAGVHLRGLNLSRFDQLVLAFSLRHFPVLQVLDLGHCAFLGDDAEDCGDPQPPKKACREKQQEEGKQSPIHLLCEALEESGCKLKTLRFDQCQLTGACGGALAAVLGTNPTLTELDLAGNEDLRDGGVRQLCQGLRRGGCHLHTLRLSCCNLTADGCRDLANVVGAMPSLEELDLSDNPLGDGGVRELCRVLVGPGCNVQKLWLWQCRLTEASCGTLAAVLPASPHLTELHLGNNELRDGGVRRLSQGLRDPGCRLQTLRLWQCRLTEASCGTLAAVLPASPHLIELHLGDNTLGDGGVRRLSQGLRDPGCRLQTLSLWQCRLTGACCRELSAALGASRSLEHLDLSENDLGDGGVRALGEGLRDPACALQRLWLKKSGLSEETLQELEALKDVKPNLNVGYL